MDTALKEYVLLTNGDLCDKQTAHIEGLAHYALSVLIFDGRRKLLLQKRTANKYHSGNLWTNTCCTHPLTTDITEIRKTAQKRLFYEMGIICNNLQLVFDTHYTLPCGTMIENEHDFVYIGLSADVPKINKSEASDFCYKSLSEIEKDIDDFPDNYTMWFRVIMNKLKINGIS